MTDENELTFPHPEAPHVRSDGAQVCVQCKRVLIKPNGTVEVEHRLVRARLTCAPVAKMVQGQLAYLTHSPIVCDDNKTCLQECLRDPRWKKANAKGYGNSILLGGSKVH